MPRAAKMSRIALLVRAMLQGATTPDQLMSNNAEYARRTRELLDIDPRTAEQNAEVSDLLGRQCDNLDAYRLYPLVRAVLEHAERNRRRGWGVVLDETPLSELCAVIGTSRTEHGAIARVAKTLAIRRNFEYLRNKQAA